MKIYQFIFSILFFPQIIVGMHGQVTGKPLVFERPRDLICSRITVVPQTLADDSKYLFIPEEQQEFILAQAKNLKLYHLQHPVMQDFVRTAIKYSLLHHKKLWQKQPTFKKDQTYNAYLSQVLTRGCERLASKINKFCRPLFFLKDLALFRENIDREWKLQEWRTQDSSCDEEEASKLCLRYLMNGEFDRFVAKEVAFAENKGLDSKLLIKALYAEFGLVK